MAVKEFDLKEIINADALRDQLDGITKVHGGYASSSQVRSEVLSLLSEASKAGREKAKERLLAGEDGRTCAWNISYLQDELIRVIYDFAVTHVYRAQNATTSEQIAITAVGGYGRGTLAPSSDIDLLFIIPYKLTSWGEQILEYILYMLWDMGFKVGHATRNIDDCIRLSKEDMTIRTSILEVRFLHGKKALYTNLCQRFSDEVVEGHAREFIEAKLEERDERHLKTGESRYLVEPNVKDGKGGLRDLHTLFWIGKYFHNVGKSHGLVKAGMFTEKEYRRFRKAEKFLWTVRCHMHFLTGRAQEKLIFDLQPEIAQLLNYSGHGGLSAVERFMKHYFLTAKEVGDLTLIACAKLEGEEAKEVAGLDRLLQTFVRTRKKIQGTKDFILVTGRINVANEDVFKNDPVNFIRFFKVADDNGIDFHPEALELITKSLKLVDADLRKNKEANEIFVQLVSSKNGPERILRRMNESGFLGKFIPEFGRIIAMMQFNMYHHFTVDEHLIRSIGALWGIENGSLAHEHPMSTEQLPKVKKREILYVALFLHDIAKGRKEDHSIAGERVANKLAPRFGFDAEDTKLISWLVRQHLTMSMMAQGRDLADRKTIQNFAEIVHTVEYMRYLLILTVCDIRAVGPGVWNGWKGQLLRTLFNETELMLSGGFSKVPMKERVQGARIELIEALSEWPFALAEEYAKLPYSAYFLSTDLETQVNQMNLLLNAVEGNLNVLTDVKTKSFEAVTEIHVVAKDQQRLLMRITGVCAAMGGNIVDAKIHTTSNGFALDVIYINRKYDEDIDELRRANEIAKTIESVLNDEVSFEGVLATYKKTGRSTKAFSFTPKVRINNEFSETFTVIDLECLDQPGILSRITDALYGMELDIGSAHVATFGERVNDSFYVRDLEGKKIVNPEFLARMETNLLNALKPSKVKRVESAKKDSAA